MPPMLNVFNQTTSVFGMPLIVVYVFGVWLVVIALTWVLARGARPDEQQKPPFLAEDAADQPTRQTDSRAVDLIFESLPSENRPPGEPH